MSSHLRVFGGRLGCFSFLSTNFTNYNRHSLLNSAKNFSISTTEKSKVQARKNQKSISSYFEEHNRTPAPEPYHIFTFSAFDLEGTGGQDKEREEIIEIAAVHIKQMRVTDHVFHTYVNPKRPIRKFPWIAPTTTDQDVEKAPTFDLIKPALQDFINGTVFLAHNARVDCRLLKLKQASIEPLFVLDTLALAKYIYKRKNKNKLGDLANQLGVDRDIKKQHAIEIRPHTALYDAYTTAYVFLEMMKTFSGDPISMDTLRAICGIKG